MAWVKGEKASNGDVAMELSNNPSKAEEIEFVRAFVESLPRNSCLKTILGEATTDIGEMIKNDFAYSPMPGLCARQRDMERELMATQFKINDAQDKLRKLGMALEDKQGKLAYTCDELQRVMNKAKRVVAALS